MRVTFTLFVLKAFNPTLKDFKSLVRIRFKILLRVQSKSEFSNHSFSRLVVLLREDFAFK